MAAQAKKGDKPVSETPKTTSETPKTTSETPKTTETPTTNENPRNSKETEQNAKETTDANKNDKEPSKALGVVKKIATSSLKLIKSSIKLISSSISKMRKKNQKPKKVKEEKPKKIIEPVRCKPMMKKFDIGNLSDDWVVYVSGDNDTPRIKRFKETDKLGTVFKNMFTKKKNRPNPTSGLNLPGCSTYKRENFLIYKDEYYQYFDPVPSPSEIDKLGRKINKKKKKVVPPPQKKRSSTTQQNLDRNRSSIGNNELSSTSRKSVNRPSFSKPEQK